MKNILIIGGGASGMMAALSCKTENTNVTIYEKNDRVGKKLLATGNGKCNLTNADFDLSHYYSSQKKQLNSYFQQFSVTETLSFFDGLGLMVRERDGYYYPFSEQASTVLDIFRNALDKKEIHVKTEVKDIQIIKKEHAFLVSSNHGSDKFDAIILACGSKAGMKQADDCGYSYAKQFGHKMIPLVPALVQVHCSEKIFKGIAGVRAKVNLQLMLSGNRIIEEQGELQLTDYGVSGIPVFQISREIAYALKDNQRITLSIDFVPNYDMQEWKEMIQKRIDSYMGQPIHRCVTGTLNKKLVVMFLKEHGLKEEDIITRNNRSLLSAMFLHMKAFEVTPVKVNPFENAQVCAGGIDLTQVDEHLESKLQKNLFLCGEMLDVDGKCGGYNLQWAWTSGYIAGKGALHA